MAIAKTLLEKFVADMSNLVPNGTFLTVVSPTLVPRRHGVKNFFKSFAQLTGFS
jgi:hypothetical protein